MDKIKYIIPLLCLLGGACSSDDMQELSDHSEFAPVQFSAFVGGGTDSPVYESDYFVGGNQIRIYCPVQYSQPDFKDDAEGMYVYTYGKKEGEPESWPFKFIPVEGKGFDWRTLELTSIYYVFESIYFPGNKYYSEVPADQTQEDSLKVADMLIAHHRQTFADKLKPVKLTFHHAFAMVQIEIKLPVSATPLDGPFPEDAVQDVYMRAMLRGYEVNYAEVIDNDAARSVVAADNGASEDSERRKDVHMRQVSKTEVETDEKGKKYQTYVYQGIVPQQNFLNEGKDFLYFKVRRHDHSESGEVGLYKYTPDYSTLTLRAAHILNLKLFIDSNTHQVVVLSAEVLPWNKAEGDMDLFPTEK